MHAHFLRLALGLPLLSAILEVADQLLLLGIHRDHRVAGGQARLGRRIEVSKLGVTVEMLRPCARLAVGLQTIPPLVQQLRYLLIADAMPLPPQLGGQPAHTLARPAQRRLRIAPRARLDQPLQVRPQRGVVRFQRLASTARPAHPPRRRRGHLPAQFLEAQADPLPREPRGPRHRADPTPAIRQRLGGGHRPSRVLIQLARHRQVAALDPLEVFHASRIPRYPHQCQRLFPDNPLGGPAIERAPGVASRRAGAP